MRHTRPGLGDPGTSPGGGGRRSAVGRKDSVMAARVNLDAATVARLAVADPVMAHLAGALPHADAGTMPPPHDVVWSAGSGCRIAYRRRSGDEPSSFDAVIVTAAGWSGHDFREDP